jgi:hypothetical protein
MSAMRRFVEDYFGSSPAAPDAGNGIGQGAGEAADQPSAPDRGPLLAELSALEKDLRDLVAKYKLAA